MFTLTSSVRTRALLPFLLSVALGVGCASEAYVPGDLAIGESAAEEATPLAGPALSQRRQRMLRMQSDLTQMRTSLEGLRVRGDRRGLRQLRRFVDAYMGLHLEPLGSARETAGPALLFARPEARGLLLGGADPCAPND